MQFRQSVCAAASWRVLAELMRRHHQEHDLRVLRTHPCSGQCDCLSVFGPIGGDPYGVSLCDFNAPVGTVHRFHGLAGRAVAAGGADSLELTERLLASDDPKQLVDEVEMFLGWPPTSGRLPLETTAVLVFRLIAGLLERTSLHRFPLEADCAWQDDSGGASVQTWAYSVPAAREALGRLPATAPWRQRMRVAAGFWAVEAPSASPADTRRVVLDLRSGDVWGEGFHLAAFGAFSAGTGRLLPVLHDIEAYLIG